MVKAKEYAVEFISAIESLTLKSNTMFIPLEDVAKEIREVVRKFAVETSDLVKARRVKSTGGLLSAIREQDDKFKAVIRILKKKRISYKVTYKEVVLDVDLYEIISPSAYYETLKEISKGDVRAVLEKMKI